MKHYYVQLNNENVGVLLISSPKKLNLPNLVSIPEYNETYLYRAWDGEQWSQERYEPDIQVQLQEKINYLENDNQELKAEIARVKEQNKQLEGTLLEMMNTIAILSGGVK